VVGDGGRLNTAYNEACAFLLKYYDEKLALVRELAIARTFTPTRIGPDISTDPKLMEIRDEIAAKMQSLPCYRRNSCLCEYLIKVLAVT
jgi:hypothetical protein